MPEFIPHQIRTTVYLLCIEPSVIRPPKINLNLGGTLLYLTLGDYYWLRRMDFTTGGTNYFIRGGTHRCIKRGNFIGG